MATNEKLNPYSKFKTKLDPLNEKDFSRWYSRYSKITGNSSNPDDAQHMYDYRGYWKDTGGNPNIDSNMHLPDTYKFPGHPSYYISDPEAPMEDRGTIQSKYKFPQGGQVKYYADGGWPYDNQQLGEELILPQQSNNYSNWGGQNSFNLPEANFPSYIGKLEQGSSPFSFESYKNKKPLYDNSFGVKGESSKRANSLQNMKGMETAGEIPEGSTAQAKANIAGSVFNAVGTGLESFAPPDSKFGKAMQKGNSFAKTAEPLKMLDMAVPGLGTGLVEGARLVGAITGGVQAKNEEIDANRIEDNTNFLKKYQNFNFDKVSQGNRMAEEGYNVQGNNDQLIQEIFQDFDNLLGIQEPQMRYGGKLYARDGYNLTNTYSNYPDPTVVPSYTPSGVLGIQGKSPEQAQEIASYMDFNQDELYQFKDNDSMKDLIPINTPGYTASRLNPIYRKMPNSKQYIPLSKQQYNKGLSFIE
jgi:hypothetical protein